MCFFFQQSVAGVGHYNTRRDLDGYRLAHVACNRLPDVDVKKDVYVLLAWFILSLFHDVFLIRLFQYRSSSSFLRATGSSSSFLRAEATYCFLILARLYNAAF